MIGVIKIDIEIKRRNLTKEFFHKIHGKLEDIMFSIIQHIPQKFISRWLMNWLDRYTDKRLAQLKQQSVKMSWYNMYLQSTTNEIHTRQQDAKEAPSDD